MCLLFSPFSAVTLKFPFYPFGCICPDCCVLSSCSSISPIQSVFKITLSWLDTTLLLSFFFFQSPLKLSLPRQFLTDVWCLEHFVYHGGGKKADSSQDFLCFWYCYNKLIFTILWLKPSEMLQTKIWNVNPTKPTKFKSEPCKSSHFVSASRNGKTFGREKEFCFPSHWYLIKLFFRGISEG